MSTFAKLDKLYLNPPVKKTFPPPVVFFADLHVGNGGKADDFAPNRALFEKAWKHYDTWTRVGVGDIEDLWQFRKSEIGAHYEWDLQLGGNHDAELKNPLAAILSIAGQEIFVTHGHVADLFNDGLWQVGRWFTRHVWKPLEELGVKDPPPAINRHEAHRKRLVQWANERRVTMVCGHIHLQENQGFYWNAGCCTQPGRIETLECDAGGLRLRVWE